jgi:hypothetical protein
MSQNEFKAIWVRESSEQFGMVLDVIPVNYNVTDQEKAA